MSSWRQRQSTAGEGVPSSRATRVALKNLRQHIANVEGEVTELTRRVRGTWGGDGEDAPGRAGRRLSGSRKGRQMRIKHPAAPYLVAAAGCGALWRAAGGRCCLRSGSPASHSSQLACRPRSKRQRRGASSTSAPPSVRMFPSFTSGRRAVLMKRLHTSDRPGEAAC
eukprot:jgi/Botrbrau1/18658/Bobra.0493s0004.1